MKLPNSFGICEAGCSYDVKRKSIKYTHLSCRCNPLSRLTPGMISFGNGKPVEELLLIQTLREYILFDQLFVRVTQILGSMNLKINDTV